MYVQVGAGLVMATLNIKEESQFVGYPSTHAFMITLKDFSKEVLPHSESVDGVVDESEHFWIPN